VVVRTVDDLDLEKLRAAGATEVVPEAIEASLMLASHALALMGVPMRRVLRIVQDQRDARYQLLRGYFHGADDDGADELEQERLSTVTLPDNRLRGRQDAGQPGAGNARCAGGESAPRQRPAHHFRRGDRARRRRHAGAQRQGSGTGAG
jgi:hypothetical protein